MKKRASFLSLYILLFAVLLFFAWAFKLTTDTNEPSPTYGDMLTIIETRQWNGRELAKIEVVGSTDIYGAGKATATFSDGKTTSVQVIGMENFMSFAREKLQGTNVILDVKAPSNSGAWISTILQFGLIIAVVVVMFIFMQQAQGGGSKGPSFVRSRARLVSDKKKVTFNDVAGLQEERAELDEIVDFLKYPAKYTAIGARIPKGIILVGPPGTGKTLLARAVAGEVGVPFYTISGSDFAEMYVGVGASRVRDLFETSKKNAPCIVFIDEVDAVGRRRGGSSGGHDEREQTLNQLLVEMDGFNVNDGVIVIAATNRPDILDPALLRPGRFDRKVIVNAPDVKGREEILKIHARGKTLADDVDFKIVARSTPGFTGADLENLLNEAALLSARGNITEIHMEEIRRAYVKVGIGTEKKSRIVSAKERRVTAYHEAGHAIIHEVLTDLEPVQLVSIIPTGSSAAGYTMHLPDEDRLYMFKSHMLKTIVAMFGGRAAEEVFFGDITTGASNDIERASALARNMVMRYGMSEKLGPILYGNETEDVYVGKELVISKNYSEDAAKSIDAEIKRILDEAYQEALRIVKENSDNIHKAVKLLIEKERITGDEFRAVIGKDSAAARRDEEVANFLSENGVTKPTDDSVERQEEKDETPEVK